MSNTARPLPFTGDGIVLEVDWLHPGQRQVFESDSRFKVVCCGRQWGKTSLGLTLAIREAAESGGHVWWISPTFDDAAKAWMVAKPMCAVIPGIRFIDRPIYRITFPTGGVLQFRSAENPIGLRGITLDGLVLDEAAWMKDDVWPTVQPTLMVRRGWCLFISTPQSDNWFKQIYDDAATLPNWESWRFPSSSSPTADPDYIEQQRLTMSSVWFAQEYLAEFISGTSGVFRSDWFRYWWPRRNDQGEVTHYMLGEANAVPIEECSRFATVDLAYSQGERADYTVIASWAVTPRRHLMLLDVMRGRYEGGQIISMLRSAYDRFNLGYLAIERNQKQLNIITEAVRQGLPVREVRADKDKLARALPTVARMEHGTIWFPRNASFDMRDLERELLSFPGGQHDDFVDALAYAVLEVAAGRSVYADRGLMTV